MKRRHELYELKRNWNRAIFAFTMLILIGGIGFECISGMGFGESFLASDSKLNLDWW